MVKKDDNLYLNEPAPPMRQPRGNLLSGWLFFLGVANILGIIRSLEGGNVLALGWGLFGIICVLGIARWFKWAYFAIYIGFMFNIASSLDVAARGDTHGGLVGILFQLTYMGVTYVLIHHRLNEFR
jgi:hypothetical protein